jgi:putative tryptophan/tyrosine transport system ATP-binding protein
MISLQSITVTFNPGSPIARRALNDLNLDIASGEFITVIGSNGAGKSTLLNVLSGEQTPDRGRVTIADRDVTSWKTPRRAQFVARVFQNPLLGSCAQLTVEENLVLAARRGRSRGLRFAINSRVTSQLRSALADLGLGLENRLQDRMGLLSGGQRQAIALLMATLSAQQQILLLDEHTAALDPQTAEDVLGLTERLVRSHGLTTLMVTHSLKQALSLGDRTVMLHQGRVIFDVAGVARAHLTVNDLLGQFERLRGEPLVDDELLLN